MYLLTLTVLLLFEYTICHASEAMDDQLLTIPITKAYKTKLQIQRHMKQLRMGASEKLNSVHDTYYYGEMYIGNPGQRVTINFDTGSSDLWVPTRLICKIMDNYCDSHNIYDHRKSSTYQKNGKPFSIVYGDNSSIAGYVSQDTISLAGIEVKNQLFAEVSSIDDVTAGTEYDGICGMSFPSTSRIGSNPPFWNMVEQGKLKEPVFAFYLNKANDSNQGELVLGGINHKHFIGNLTYTPVTNNKHWKFKINRIYVHHLTIRSAYGVADTGTSFISGPSKYIDPINRAIGATPVGIYYIVNCDFVDSLPNVTFVINKTKFVLTSRDYIHKQTDKYNKDYEWCVSGFSIYDDEDFLIVGDIFLRKFYTVFDLGNHRLGFARSK